jgi:hypothetical protein
LASQKETKKDFLRRISPQLRDGFHGEAALVGQIRRTGNFECCSGESVCILRQSAGVIRCKLCMREAFKAHCVLLQ